MRLRVKPAIWVFGGFVLGGVVFLVMVVSFSRDGGEPMISLVCVREGLFTKVHGEIVERRVSGRSF
jgi:hypothetical protein